MMLLSKYMYGHARETCKNNQREELLSNKVKFHCKSSHGEKQSSPKTFQPSRGRGTKETQKEHREKPCTALQQLLVERPVSKLKCFLQNKNVRHLETVPRNSKLFSTLFPSGC